MKFYTVILRKSADYWVALCLENGLVGQGNTPDQIIKICLFSSTIFNLESFSRKLLKAAPPITIKLNKAI
uniref:Type II toxin-antitoxin system HicB family antitoxin n=1 Tax=Gloeothece verrucosa (strain PCC 7822) TaxID=497965 RepID=E0UBF7_GLOV7|nr:hypothetical protein Cyan7822_0763 [Gloeothece verrucosa PCC 7822]